MKSSTVELIVIAAIAFFILIIISVNCCITFTEPLISGNSSLASSNGNADSNKQCSFERFIKEGRITTRFGEIPVIFLKQESMEGKVYCIFYGKVNKYGVETEVEFYIDDGIDMSLPNLDEYGEDFQKTNIENVLVYDDDTKQSK